MSASLMKENLRWLRLVRWLTWPVLAALVTWMSLGLGVKLELFWVALILLLGFGSNLALAFVRAPGEGTLFSVMLLDVVLHTALFFFSGGPFNPFTTLYLVNIALGTLMLSRRRQLVQLVACVTGFASLFVLEKVVGDSLALPNHAQLMRLHLAGMLLAFLVAAAFIVAFMERLLADLTRAREAAARNEKLAALTTLTAGAAHELGTPLGTIAVTATELSRAQLPDGVREDVLLVREQVARCREILARMSAKSGEVAGERFTRVGVDEWVRQSVNEVRAQVTVQAAPGLAVLGPPVALTQALTNLLRNAAAASQQVTLKVEAQESRLVLRVEDDGPALAPEILSRLGEPFFTTRPAGQGLGLGVFLARTLADQLGGSLRYERGEARGTVARLELPLA